MRNLKSVSQLVALGLLALIGACKADAPADTTVKAAAHPDPARPVRPPDVILITVDTLRVDHLGSYGYIRDTSPTIDSLSKDGVTFNRAHTPMATTLPAHASLFTGQNPSRHGILGNFDALGEAFEATDARQTLPQIARRLGYQTAAFISATPVKRHSGLAVGFDVFDEPEAASRLAAETLNQASAWLGSRSDAPAFVWIHLWDPHLPYTPPSPYDSLYQTDEPLKQWMASRTIDVTPFFARVHNQYDGEIRYLDDQLGPFINSLKKRGMYDSSLIVFTADHGEALGQHRWIDHGRIFQEELHIPLILKLPGGGHAGRRDSRLTSLIDVYLTVAAAAGWKLTPSETQQAEGGNLLSRHNPDYVYSERVKVHRDMGDDYLMPWEPGRKYALIGNRYKYFHLTEGADQLFDLATDPGETRDVIAAHPEIARAMGDELKRRIAAYSATARPPAKSQLDADTVDQLKTLGYVQ